MIDGQVVDGLYMDEHLLGLTSRTSLLTIRDQLIVCIGITIGKVGDKLSLTTLLLWVAQTSTSLPISSFAERVLIFLTLSGVFLIGDQSWAALINILCWQWLLSMITIWFESWTLLSAMICQVCESHLLLVVAPLLQGVSTIFVPWGRPKHCLMLPRIFFSRIICHHILVSSVSACHTMVSVGTWNWRQRI